MMLVEKKITLKMKGGTYNTGYKNDGVGREANCFEHERRYTADYESTMKFILLQRRGHQ